MSNSVPNRKTGSRWLDRLRIAKGFPDAESSDLENFLQNPNYPELETEKSNPNPSSSSTFGPIQSEDNQLCNVMSSVLNELFCFGDNCSNLKKPKKSARKQSNPSICAFPDTGTDGNKNVVSVNLQVLRSTDDNGGMEAVKVVDTRENEEEGDVNLLGFSRTEVTVIDTSYEAWKFEKLLYRKKNVWKVRNKKGRNENVGNKRKRKAREALEKDQCVREKSNIAVKEGRAMEYELPLEAYHQNDKSEAREKAPEKVRKLLKNNGGSSSIPLIKSVPSLKKSGNKHFRKLSEVQAK